MLELLLMLGIPRRDVKPLAKDIIDHFNDFAGVVSADESFALRFDDLFTEYSIGVRQDKHGHLIAFVVRNVCGHPKSFNAEPSLFRNIKIFHLRVAFFTKSLRLDVAVKAAQESLPQCVFFHLFGEDCCTIFLIPASLDLKKFSFMYIT